MTMYEAANLAKKAQPARNVADPLQPVLKPAGRGLLTKYREIFPGRRQRRMAGPVS